MSIRGAFRSDKCAIALKHASHDETRSLKHVSYDELLLNRSFLIQIQDYSLQGFDIYNDNTKCPDTLCPYLGNVHYHCNQNRCLYVTDKGDVLIMHSKDFHDNIDILDGFEFYDRNVDCRLPNCPSNKVNRHFHCTRANCNYSFVQYSTMSLHNQKHLDEGKANAQAYAHPEVKVKNEPMAEERSGDELTNENPVQFSAMNLSQSTSDNKVSGEFVI